ncbi:MULTISPECIES: hypothetical protein [unclassified Methylobacterium]|jgi:hypothetical protein|uniref:hypothetical protein n=1 Tax=unclassified Methylobacterium TaxID=2615210 RepID=UPI001355BF6C|nr:hypothetical protein [Methylobacterium sp. 2A]MWV25075.1 hypothetical protein [Methylobacterium sp. 2A]
MSAQTAIEILDSLFDIFKQMGGGIALDLHWLAISRRLQQVRAEADWSADLDFVAVRLKAQAAFYIARYRPSDGPEPIRPADAARLEKVVEQYSILRAHLEQQVAAR